ncbi:hypothetical protein QVD17_17903 [Tagetes erecta]|uniref:Uncharacterized protein n=1 Tax=Tagetes erecta TaxID=13708 RepID=A0AAD8KJH7_TARER|nr:hypothetical protein QVD17_17903 [Tagetes erecta]
MFQPDMSENLHDHVVDMSHETPENNLGDDDHNPSNMEVPSSDDQDPNLSNNKKSRLHHRHNQDQIQELEGFFKECPHPNNKQRKELSKKLSLRPSQVKFWFQNKRTQIKAQRERIANIRLREENEKLRAEDMRLKEVLANAICRNCKGPVTNGEMSFDEQRLRIENDHLHEEIKKLSGIIDKYAGKQPLTYPDVSSNGSAHSRALPRFTPQQGMFAANDPPARSMALHIQTEKTVIIDLAIAAMDELIKMVDAGEPLWVPTLNDLSHETLNEDEYMRLFPRGSASKPTGLKSEGSRESMVVMMNHMTLVEILMDANQWSNMFCGMVPRATTLEVISSGVTVGNFNGALQVMAAEYQVPSPLVRTRESYFARYCKQLDNGTWAVVDVSVLDNMRSSSIARCRRRPSGCLIQALPNGCSKVTWIENVEVDTEVIHDLYKVVVNSGLAFGAKRWVATLERQCKRLVTASDIPEDLGGKYMYLNLKSMLKLAERMVLSYCRGVGASTAHTWTTLSGGGLDNVRVMTQKSMDDPGKPHGIVLSAATSIWLPIPPKQVFNFLRDVNFRSKWDFFSNCEPVQEMAHIANGRDPENCVSLLRVNSANSSESNILLLQETSSDSTGSYVIYAPVDVAAMNVVLNGGDPDYVAFLPSGFAILPDGPGQYEGEVVEVGTGGSLITVALQILATSDPTAKISVGSVETANALIKCTVERIKCALVSDNV